MKQNEWNELLTLQKICESDDATAEERLARKKLLDKTRSIDEHPEGYEGPCLCRLCLSYL